MKIQTTHRPALCLLLLVSPAATVSCGSVYEGWGASHFAKAGNPNSPALPPWPDFTNNDSKILYLGNPIVVGGVVNINGLNVFDTVYSILRGRPLIQP
jgi:hypothetical protein